MSLPVGGTVDQFRIVAPLGDGGMGEVYLADDTALGRRVVLKFLPREVATDASAVERFRREARATAALEHPNIAGIHHIGSHEGRPYLVMSFVEGTTLADALEGGALPPGRARFIATEVARGLSAAHRAGIVHRDIKPSNIMLASDGRVLILDFGLAKLQGASSMTQAGTTMGTAPYMSPEQVRGEDVDARTDVFSLGAVLYEMLAGRRPFHAEHREAVFYSILNETPPPVDTHGDAVGEALAQVAKRAMEKKREDRFATVDDMLAALERAGGTDASAGAPGLSAEDAWRQMSRIGAALMAIALLVFVGVRLVRHGSGDAAHTGGGSSPPPTMLTTTQLTVDPALEQWPAWSPDGRQLVYAAETNGFKKLAIRDVAGDSVRIVTTGPTDDIQPAWSPDGRKIAFVRANLPTGRLAPSDVQGFFYEGGDIYLLDVASGESTRIIDDAFNPAFSPDGTRISFDATRAGPRRIWATDTRGRNPQQLTTDVSEAVSHVGARWAPDGRRIVYRRVQKTRGDIEMTDLDTGTARRLTDDVYNDAGPTWSPDGRAVYFSSYRGGGLNIWRIAVTGDDAGTPEQVTTGAGDDVQPAVSPDGKRLAFTVLGLNSDLWRLPLDPGTGAATGAPQALVATTREDSRGAWSPDGTRIAFNSDRSGDMNIWIHSIADNHDEQLTHGAGGDYQSNWSPDGTDIVFFSSRSGNADIWRVTLADGKLEQLTTYAGLDVNPFYSPDGTHIAFQTDRGGRSELWVMDRDGTGARRIADAEASGHFARWFADGKRILFASGEGGDRVIYTADVESGALTKMRPVSSGAHMSFSPDQTRVLDVAGHRVVWIYPLNGDPRSKVLEFDDPDIRIDYPVWSPDGRWAVFDHVTPRGGDIWLLSGL